jgi:hypothetical protein
MELRLMYNRESVGALADAIAAVYPQFASAPFLAAVFAPGWDDLALKERMRRITTVLHDFLPQDYGEALAILRRALPLLDEQGFEKMVFPDYVDCYGREDLDASLDALELFTQEVSAEFAIRPSSSATRRRRWRACRHGPATPTPAYAAWPARAAARACPGHGPAGP